ncbi:MAG: NusG domain II-containing protein [Candidatus Syntrophosphaera sp.]|jgi:hypothetical protein
MLGFLRDHLSLADFMLVGAVILAIVLSSLSFCRKNDEKYAYIYKDSRSVGVYPLNEDRIIRIDSHNTVGIKDSKVMMLESDCPRQTCVRQGAGDTLPIICLPNRVVVEIREHDKQRILIIR